jgi:hypothetical protein
VIILVLILYYISDHISINTLLYQVIILVLIFYYISDHISINSLTYQQICSKLSFSLVMLNDFLLGVERTLIKYLGHIVILQSERDLIHFFIIKR